MRIQLIQIGNSKGFRLPKKIIDQYQIQDEMELILNEQDLTLKPLKKIREGWNEAFQQMHANGDDQLLIDDVFADENFEE
jgi:antitoxin MazE